MDENWSKGNYRKQMSTGISEMTEQSWMRTRKWKMTENESGIREITEHG